MIDGVVHDLSPEAIKACFRHVLTTYVAPVEGIKPEPAAAGTRKRRPRSVKA